jgi:hypothetical protein
MGPILLVRGSRTYRTQLGGKAMRTSSCDMKGENETFLLPSRWTMFVLLQEKGNSMSLGPGYAVQAEL